MRITKVDEMKMFDERTRNDRDAVVKEMQRNLKYRGFKSGVSAFLRAAECAIL
jgi:hypothetical protein